MNKQLFPVYDRLMNPLSVLKLKGNRRNPDRLKPDHLGNNLRLFGDGIPRPVDCLCRATPSQVRAAGLYAGARNGLVRDLAAWLALSAQGEPAITVSRAMLSRTGDFDVECLVRHGHDLLLEVFGFLRKSTPQ